MTTTFSDPWPHVRRYAIAHPAHVNLNRRLASCCDDHRTWESAHVALAAFNAAESIDEGIASLVRIAARQFAEVPSVRHLAAWFIEGAVRDALGVVPVESHAGLED